jgi:cytochrome oxidase Cu insertion factor (SCO1/SenC/PrrC family)
MRIGDLVQLDMIGEDSSIATCVAVVISVDPNDDECEVMYHWGDKMQYTWVFLSYAEKRRVK